MLYSPLRYPGGKNKLSAFIANVCLENKIDGHYVEPYSGGASVALFLLMEGFVKEITINDKDKAIYSFWYAVLNRTDELCERISSAELNIIEWRKQRAIQYRKDSAEIMELAFSTFYLNRTNRSGIIYSGVIGGVEQKGNYLMDCRFNKQELIRRIKRIAQQKNHITLFNKDALDLIETIQVQSTDTNVIFYFDPPYYLKAESLYLNHYAPKDHELVSKTIQAIDNFRWIVSYDNVPEINNLYHECPKKEFSFKHTAYKIREGKEVLFFSKNLKQPDIPNWNPVQFKKKKLGQITYKH